MGHDGRFDGEKLRQAKIGSHRAFRALVEPYRSELQRHCYRMTGSFDDADDLVQETLFRAWRGLGAYVSRGSFRAWLYRIATNRTLDLLGSAHRRREIVNSAGEPPWLQPYPTSGSLDETGDAVVELESISLAFVVALQNLPGRQRAALLLCDVLGFTPTETADVLDTTRQAANSLLQRARGKIARIQPIDRAPAADDDQKALVAQFAAAWRDGDTAAMVALLDESAQLTMPPHALEFVGKAAIVELLLDEARFADHRRVEFVPVQASGEHGFATYVRNRDGDLASRHCIMLFGSAAGAATKITGFTEDSIFDLLDLPRTVKHRAAST